MNNYIEFTHSDKSLNKNIKRECFCKLVEINDIKDAISKNNFSGIAHVYNNNKLIYKVAVSDGNFNGEFIKYEDFVPKSLYGSATGLIAGWRQPVLVANYRSNLLDGLLTIYKQDGTKLFAFTYNMSTLDGEQKHYVDYSKFVHLYKKGVWEKTTKMAKSWIWSDKSNELESHLELVKQHQRNLQQC